MAPSKSIVALFLSLALVATTVQHSNAMRVPTNSAAAARGQEAGDVSSTNADAVAKPTAPPAGQVPGFRFPRLTFQFPGFPFPPFPFPGAPPAGGGLPFPLFPPIFPLPGTPSAGQLPLFPPLPPLPGLPQPGSPGTPSPASSAMLSAQRSTSSASSSSSSPPQVTNCLPPLMGLMTPCMGYLTNNGGVSAPPSACCDSFKALVDNAPICLCHGLNGGDVSKLMLAAPMDFARMTSLPETCRVALPMQTLAKCAAGPAVPPIVMPPPSPLADPSPSAAPSPYAD